MGNQRCTNGELDTSKYSSPMPAIGLYVTGSTLVCLLFILLDIYAGFRNRKRWLPCRFFSLNSVTLTLFGVATKLPVDLTTAMPSGQDQLSKLTGTTFLCICMGVLMPSLGRTTKSECLSNMTALTIFVITVFVNVCLQMHTGVIIAFKVEHIIVLCCMMILLSELWLSAVNIQMNKKDIAVEIKSHYKKGQGSLLQRLKTCYLYGYQTDPQLQSCRRSICCKISGLCIVCAAILVEVIFRSIVFKDLEFCKGISDYRWSMRAIVASQTITVFLGCMGTTIRFLSMANHLELDDNGRTSFFGDCTWLQNDLIRVIFLSPVEAIVDLIYVLLTVGYILVHLMKRLWKARSSDSRTRSDKPKEECLSNMTCYSVYEEIKSNLKIYDWTSKKCVKEMQKLTQMNKLKATLELLRKTPSPSQKSLTYFFASLQLDYEISPIAVVILARTIAISIPPSLSQCVYDSLEEIFEVLHYIARKTSSQGYFNRYNHLRDSWLGVGHFEFLNKPEAKDSQSQTEADQAIQVIKNLYQHWLITLSRFQPLGLVAEVLRFIKRKDHTSIEDLYRDMEQIIVHMLREMLGQLPCIIFKDINESSLENMEEKVKDALQVISKVEQLQSLIPWSFPVGTTITSLVTNDAACGIQNIENQRSVLFEGTSSSAGHTKDEIIEVK